MPQISIPSPYSSSNLSDSEGSPITPRSAFPFTVPGTSIDPVITPSTSAEPPFTPSGLGLAFSQVELQSQTSEESDMTSSKASDVSKRLVHKVNTGRFQKGVGCKRKLPMNRCIILLTQTVNTYTTQCKLLFIDERSNYSI